MTPSGCLSSSWLTRLRLSGFFGWNLWNLEFALPAIRCQLWCLILGGITFCSASSSTYSYTFLHMVVCHLLHLCILLKLFDRLRCYLADTLVWFSHWCIVLDCGPWSSTKLEIGGRTALVEIAAGMWQIQMTSCMDTLYSDFTCCEINLGLWCYYSVTVVLQDVVLLWAGSWSVEWSRKVTKQLSWVTANSSKLLSLVCCWNTGWICQPVYRLNNISSPSLVIVMFISWVELMDSWTTRTS